MDTAIVVAIITGLFTLVGTMATVHAGNKKQAKQLKEQSDLTIYRIKELEKKQDKYNHLQERTMNNEQKIAVVAEDVRAIRERIDYLHKD